VVRQKSYHGATHGALSLTGMFFFLLRSPTNTIQREIILNIKYSSVDSGFFTVDLALCRVKKRPPLTEQTGDNRRWLVEPHSMGGIVRVGDPYKYRSVLYREGDTDEEFSARLLEDFEQTLQFENPESVAAVLMEPVTGTNGLIVPPKAYMKGVWELCDKYGILLIIDEVMSGVGRFSFLLFLSSVLCFVLGVMSLLTCSLSELGNGLLWSTMILFLTCSSWQRG
jgi:adenosylmethionine-8-amino-7-oxononanoate aminotransferase